AAQIAFGFEHSYRSRYALWGSHGRIGVERAFTPPGQLQPPVHLEGQDRRTELALAADHQILNAVRSFAERVRTGAHGPVDEDATLRQACLVETVRGVARVTGECADA
ncbi:MAG TPA: gfo/Idh/MocA family oxidoreductase, partial [Rugosimonospora sp.]|nr:gfo/Idh/MocA family oxidoreductase [Rugosimonospora sp.]